MTFKKLISRGDFCFADDLQTLSFLSHKVNFLLFFLCNFATWILFRGKNTKTLVQLFKINLQNASMNSSLHVVAKNMNSNFQYYFFCLFLQFVNEKCFRRFDSTLYFTKVENLLHESSLCLAFIITRLTRPYGREFFSIYVCAKRWVIGSFHFLGFSAVKL